jgi:hypothetical protein
MDMQGWLRKRLEDANPDLLREMVKSFAEALMGAECDAICGAAYGERSPERVKPPKRLPETRLGHPRRHGRARDPQAPPGRLLSGLAARAAPARRAGARTGRGRL